MPFRDVLHLSRGLANKRILSTEYCDDGFIHIPTLLGVAGWTTYCPLDLPVSQSSESIGDFEASSFLISLAMT